MIIIITRETLQDTKKMKPSKCSDFSLRPATMAFCGSLVLMKSIPIQGAGQKDLILHSVPSRSHGLIMPKKSLFHKEFTIPSSPREQANHQPNEPSGPFQSKSTIDFHDRSWTPRNFRYWRVNVKVLSLTLGMYFIRKYSLEMGQVGDVRRDLISSIGSAKLIVQ